MHPALKRALSAVAVSAVALAVSVVVASPASAGGDEKNDRSRYSNGHEPVCFKAIDRVARLIVKINVATDAVAAATADLAAKKAALTTAQATLNGLLPLETPVPSAAELAAQLAVTEATNAVATAQAALNVKARTLADLNAQKLVEAAFRDRVCKLPNGTPASSTPPAPSSGAPLPSLVGFNQISDVPTGPVDTGGGQPA